MIPSYRGDLYLDSLPFILRSQKKSLLTGEICVPELTFI
jgi:hypothetical protein